jgi:outer membrane protein OmpA-like peptidoglycan-associated protein
MSDEKTPAADEPKETRGEQAAAAFTKTALSPVAILGFVVIALLVVLVVTNARRGGGGNISPGELNELQAEARALREQLNRERVAMGLRPMEGNVESMQDIAARLSKDADTMVALASSFQKMLAEKDAAISAKNAELLRSEQLRQTLANESVRLQGELQRAIAGGAESELLRSQLAVYQQERDALAAQLDKARQELAANTGGVSAGAYADLQRQLEEITRARDFFEARAAELEGQLSKARLFARSEDELMPAAVELFRRLRKLEGRPDSEISSAYSSLGVELGASVLHTLNFKTGSSELTPADEEIIRKLVDEIPDSDLLLAIGYASETGNVDKNQELSSARATAAAGLYSSIKRPDQLVQAVYLGQTDRFSSKIPERNQIVELWRIRKQ